MISNRMCSACITAWNLIPLISFGFFETYSFSDQLKQSFSLSWEKTDSMKSKNNLAVSQINTVTDLCVEDNEPWWRKALDPSSKAVFNWNRIFLVACLISLFVDPFFFYFPVVNDVPTSKSSSGALCMTRSNGLGIAVTFFRSLADLLYMVQVIVKFRTAFVAPSSRVFGRGELVRDPYQIARRYIRSDFCLDLLAALPLPQIIVWFIIPAMSSFHSTHMTNALELVVFIQYLPRLYLINPLSSQIINATGIVTNTAWGGAGYNLLLYMLASHVVGACWYLLSIERVSTCWKLNCQLESGCFTDFLDCQNSDAGRTRWAKRTRVFINCDPTNPKHTYDFGIFESALSKNVVSSGFVNKYFYCLWWGLQNLSCYGQNLVATTFVVETLFSILICTLGLILFAQLIGNMQTYLQSITLRLEQWRLKGRDTEEWMGHRQLPQNLRERVRRYLQYKWVTTRGVDEEAILLSLPTDLRRDIRRHQCLGLVRRVPLFAQMDDQLLDAICERLKSCLSTQGTFVVCEGDPVTEMLFIIRGKIESSTTNGGRSGFFNSTILGPGDFCGEELLAWALLSKSTLPYSTRTVKALVEVEGFTLSAEDLKCVANQFRHLHSRKLQHTFRHYSHHWRTWAACFIQAAWRRSRKRMMKKSLSLLELFSESSYDNNANENVAAQEKNTTGMKKVALDDSPDLELAKIAKPEEPDFSSDPHD